MAAHAPQSRWPFRVTLLVGIAATVAWCLYLPYDRATLARILPDSAELAVRIADPGARAPELLAHPLLDRMAEHGLFDPAPMRAALREPWRRWLLARLARGELAAGRIAHFGRYGEPTWLAATWGGAYAQVLRLALAVGRVGEWHTLDNGRRVHVMGRPGPGRPALTVASSTGYILLCWSSDPRGAGLLLNRLEGRPAPNPVFRPPPVAPVEIGWVRRDWRAWPAHTNVVRLVLTAWPADVVTGVTGRVRWDDPGAAALADVAPAPEHAARVWRELAPGAAAAGLTPLSALRDWAGRLPAGWPLARVIMAAIAVADPAAPAGVALYGDANSGRAMGLRVPTLSVMVKLQDPALPLPAVARDVADRINATHAWGLLMRPLPDLPAGIAVDSIQEGLFGSLADDERPVLLAREGWLYFHSNAGFLGRRATTGATLSGPAPDGRQPELRIATAQTGTCLRHALAVWELGLRNQGIGAGDTRSARLADWREAIRAWEDAGRLTLTLEPDGAGAAFELILDRPVD